MDNAIRMLQNLGLVRLAITGAIISSIAYAAFFLMSHVAKPEMALLYSDLEAGDAGRIISNLEDRGIDVKMDGGGTQVYVPVDLVAKLRMELAEAGLPNTGSVGYEIFDKSDVFGSSYFVQNINHVRALEGELSRTIKTLSQIASARVHLVLPRKELFSKDTQEPTASIVIRMQTPGKLDDSRVKAIQHLVASAVPGLTPDNVSIVDDRGNLLTSGRVESGMSAAKSNEIREEYEGKLERAIETILSRTLGTGRVRTEVTADMDFDRLEENSEIFDPEGKVERSTQTVKEGSNSSESTSAAGGESGAGSELPGAGGGAGSSGNSKNDSNRNEETINYEISKTIRNHVRETGLVKKLSVAVLVDGTHEKGKDGKDSYTPLKPEEMKNIEKLVKSAIGFDEKRGDTVEVINMPFKADEGGIDAPLEEGLFFGIEKHQLVRVAETIILALFALLGVLLVAKPLLNRIIEGMEKMQSEPMAAYPGATGTAPALAQIPGSAPTAALPNAGARPAISAPDDSTQQDHNLPKNEGAQKLDNMITLKQIEGQVRESSIQKVNGIIDNHPEETVNIVRSWMSE